jgi:hypothetical protein
MGWLGWPPAVCLATDVNFIRMALNGRQDLFAMIGLVKPRPQGSRTATQPEWQAFKNRVNQIQRVRERGVRRRSGADG